jgi:hypothetical protein
VPVVDLRGVSLGRKNYLFMGSTRGRGGERAAGIYSLVETAKLNGLDPEAICAKCWRALPSIPSTASTSCCRGTSAHIPKANDKRPSMATKDQWIKAPAAILQLHIELRGLTAAPPKSALKFPVELVICRQCQFHLRDDGVYMREKAWSTFMWGFENDLPRPLCKLSPSRHLRPAPDVTVGQQGESSQVADSAGMPQVCEEILQTVPKISGKMRHGAVQH